MSATCSLALIHRTAKAKIKLTGVQHVCSYSHGYLRFPFCRPRDYLHTGRLLVLVGHCPSHRDWSSTGFRHDHRRRWCSSCPMVRPHLRDYWKRNSSAVRSASQTGDSGPYRFVRNPMYIGAGLALAGATLFYGSLPLLIYTVAFFLVTHLFVVLYEEPTLRRTFGQDYEMYCSKIKRW